MNSNYCRWQEAPAILISKLLYYTCPASTVCSQLHLDFHEKWIECTERNLIMCIWNFYQLSDHACFDHETLAKHTIVYIGEIQPSIVVACTP